MKAPLAKYIGMMEWPNQKPLYLFNVLRPLYNKEQKFTHPIGSTLTIETINENCVTNKVNLTQLDKGDFLYEQITIKVFMCRYVYSCFSKWILPKFQRLQKRNF